MMHLDPAWLKKSYEGIFNEPIELAIESTLRSDPQLSHLILSTYNILNNNESQLMKDTYLDLLLENLVNKKFYINVKSLSRHYLILH
ncbi:araC1 domain protein (plasmid) [Acinetobacter baumannii]|nr:araC1 domain protein [Acinetobacter baumannii]